MTQITPPPIDDDLPDERELAALYARLPKTEPDASLDAAVLAAATRAMPVKRRPRWPVAVASAAVLVLAVGVAWQVRELPPPATSTIPMAATPATVKSPTTDSLDGRAAESIAAEAAPTGELSKPRDAGAQASRAGAAAMNAGAASARVGADSSAIPAQRAASHRAVSPAATTHVRLNVSAPPSVTEPVAAPVALAPAAPAAPPEPYAPPAPPAPPAPAAAAEAEAAIVSAAPVPAPAPQRLDATAPAPSSLPQHDDKAAPAPSGMLMRKTVPTALGPDDRVGEIRRLLDRGDRAQALRELTDLRRRYPDYDLPQDLRDLNP
ncbi:hypothetical protein BJI69_16290 [Luteibacter rhizovicinus DSM 16549]|uniref:Uncharacterized protein n=1 Tax=Luteibacter rhizovicinus DSM 16549 TaxID=1440763 RepID=A0A0G9HFH9_9GAMM|nr:hypothetical protein [Luteibacter rhizovicinus]APG05305.1 hypothetical protein BJI69_16290 [Luteibacter rhizovicinus DSM 16549]KLD67924.1 hypothetical protein Y883_05965 [Luteibacter rhizovicinus DSM 16549]KLD76094.1 hypothetical protein Y886_23270 [Xanthomonas hyacinthi DSM 19077]